MAKPKMKRIRVDVYPSSDNNVVKMERVARDRAPTYLSSLEKSLAAFKAKHRHGSEIFLIEDLPGSSLRMIAESIDAELFSVVLKEPEEERTPKLTEISLLQQLDAEVKALRALLKVKNKQVLAIVNKRARR